MHFYLCDEHGGGTEDCCPNNSNIGWFEERTPEHTLEEQLESKDPETLPNS